MTYDIPNSHVCTRKLASILGQAKVFHLKLHTAANHAKVTKNGSEALYSQISTFRVLE